MPFTLAPLPYAHDALEPHIDTLTMQIHHGKHHQAYVDNLNKAITGTTHEGKSIEELVAASPSKNWWRPPAPSLRPSGTMAADIGTIPSSGKASPLRVAGSPAAH